MSTKNNEIKQITYPCNGKTLTFIKPLIMAVVNVTPDSFYDGGKYGNINELVRDAEEKVMQGATIIDIGAASSRPHAPEVSEEEEWRRLEKVIPVLRKNFPEIFLSVDTFRAGIAMRAAEHGADIINDISGGSLDPKMFDAVAELNLPYVLMHMPGNPQTMSAQPEYRDVVGSVLGEFDRKINALRTLGFSRLILDPGFGFGKSLRNNYQLLKELNTFRRMGYPLLAGVSRKSMINKVLGTNPVTALNGTTVLNTIALLNGASVLRVHDVAEARQAIELVEFYKHM